uniref:Uncharacterized protein n=1 Tax=Solanum lycopersicum TaxID=4081 RepID=A0A3Q7J8N9_SOLLC
MDGDLDSASLQFSWALPLQVSFLVHHSTYFKSLGSPLTRICQVLVAPFHKWNLPVPDDSTLFYETTYKISVIDGSRKQLHIDELRNRLYVVYAQIVIFVEQGTSMDTAIGSFRISPASIIIFNSISVSIWVPIYDRILVPIASRLTVNEMGFSKLQRIGIGLFLYVLCMLAAAIVEFECLQLARDLDLMDELVAVPLNIFWQIPHYFILGVAEIFTSIGHLEFFNDQSPNAMCSLCSALTLMITAMGNYLSSFILTVVTSITTQDGKPGWIPNNLNSGHLDYFFLLFDCT